MTLSRLAPVAVALGLLVPSGALGAPLGFSDPAPVGSGDVGQTAAAVGTGGAALLAATVNAGDPRQEGVRAWSRTAPGAPWTQDTLAHDLSEARDVQAAVTRQGDRVVVWSQIHGTSDRVAYAIRDQGGALRQTGSFAVRDGYSATPRLAVLGSGIVLLAFRDNSTLRVARAAAGATAFAAPRTVATGASALAIAPAGPGATLLWSSTPGRRGTPRTLRAVRLRDSGRVTGAVEVVSHDATASVRLGGISGGRAIASWIRPAKGSRVAAAFTRSLTPDGRPARVFPAPGTPRSPATITEDADDVQLGAIAGVGGNPFGFRTLMSASRFGGVWFRVVAPGGPAAMVGVPRPALDGTRQLIAYTQSTDAPGPASYDVVVAQRDNVDAPVQTGVVDSGVTTSDGAGLVLAQAGSRLMLAWPAPGGGWRVSERS
jgi:hypothetical protein